MKRSELIAELRRLQARAYEADARAEQASEREDEKPRNYSVSEERRRHERVCFERGWLGGTTRSLAREIDELIERLAPSRRRAA